MNSDSVPEELCVPDRNDDEESPDNDRRIPVRVELT